MECEGEIWEERKNTYKEKVWDEVFTYTTQTEVYGYLLISMLKPLDRHQLIKDKHY